MTDCRPTEPPEDFDIATLREIYRREREKRLRAEGSKQYVELADDFAGYYETDPYSPPLVRRSDIAGHRRRCGRRRLRRPVGRCASEEGRCRGCPDHRAGRGFRRRLVLEPLSRESSATTNPIATYPCSKSWTSCQQEVRRRRRDLRALPAHRQAFRSLRFGHLLHTGPRRCAGTSRSSGGASEPTATTTSAPGSSSWLPGPSTGPSCPAFPGSRTSTDTVSTPSRWDYEYTGGDISGGLDKLGDKRVALVGTGATGIQVVPSWVATPSTSTSFSAHRRRSTHGTTR